MNRISQLEVVKSTIVYKPLITKKGWIVVSLAIASILSLSFNTSKDKMFTLPEFNFSFLEKFSFSGFFESLSVSNTTFLIAVVFGLLMSIQIIYLKGFFEKRLH